MTQTKTKKALLMSVLSMVLCVAMLVGMTFAWFTDTASTGVNKIQAGNLDVELEYSTDYSNWEKVTNATKLFSEEALWEPGRTDIVYLRVKNAGNLALKYNIGIYNLYDYNGKNVEGKSYKLSEYLKLGTVETATAYATREDSISAVDTNAKTLKDIGATTIIGSDNMIELNPSDAAKTYALVLYMPTDVGNEANPKSVSDAAKVQFGIEVNATQAMSESDSYDNTYDKDAATILKRVEFSAGTHEVTGNIQASGKWGTISVAGGTTTINANVNAVYDTDAAIAVWASANWNGTRKGHVIINGGYFRQSGVPNDKQSDLIYADKGATIEINGGTFKADNPQWTLNCKDGSGSTITVKGGTFYKFDPSNANTGAGEIIVPNGYSVVKNGDWYTVIEGTVVNTESEFADALTNATMGSKIILNCDIIDLSLADGAALADGIIIDGQNKFSISLDAWRTLSNLSITIQNAQMG